MEDSNPPERRRHHRAQVEVPVRVVVFIADQDTADIRFGLSRDLSESGIFIFDPTPSAIGARVEVTFDLPTGGVTATGIVRRVVDATDKPAEAGMGIEFVDVSSAHRDTISRFIVSIA